MSVKLKFTLLGILLLFTSLASAFQDGTIELGAFPNVVVADGRSPITITAVVRDPQGQLVPNGTQVVFDTTLGSFRENIVTTENGYARATLIPGTIAGIPRIRASVLKYNANGSIELEYVSDRALLSAAKEYIEIDAPKTMLYSMNERIIEASGADQGVHLRYRDVEVRADDVQLRVPSYEMRARNAKITIGKNTYTFEQVNMKLNQKKGFGLGTFELDSTETDAAGYLVVPIKTSKLKYGPVSFSASGVRPFEGMMDSRLLKFQDITESLSSVEAKKAVAYPAREIYFYKSNVKVSGVSIMKVPLFQVNTNSASPLVTEQFFNVSNNSLNVNYPYYLSLKPGEISLFRLRYGNRFGSSAGATQGLFLDYELKWNQGDQNDGGLTFSGLNRQDWGATLRQYMQPDPSTTITAQLDFPAHRSAYANVGVSKLFDGFQVNFSGTHGRSLGDQSRFQNNQLLLIAEKDPMKLGKLPAQITFGLTAQTTQFNSEFANTSQKSLGLQARLTTKSIRLDKSSSLSATYRIAEMTGVNVREGLSHFATVTLASNLGRGLVLQNTYDYVNDGFNSVFLGQHRLSSEAYYSEGKFSGRGFVSKTLDLDRLNAQASLNYEFAPKWRLYYSYYMDQYLTDTYLDQRYIIGYTLGFREFGLSYSMRTKRIGIEILGTRF